MHSVNDSLRRLAARYEIDVISGDEGLTCYIKPTETFEIKEDTPKSEIKAFAFSGETVGFLSYDYGMLLRGVQTDKRRELPLGVLKHYKAKIVFGDVITGDTELLADLPPALPAAQASRGNRITSSADEAAYITGCEKILDQIRSGNTYQLNYAVKYEFTDPHFAPLEEFLRLKEQSPAAFAAYINAGCFSILSLSPERFIRCNNGHILSQPIKGTYKTDSEGLTDAHRLTNSPKECAELSMIVDMIRNDIGINAEYGSVRVENHKSVFRINSLLQMYADVLGELKDEADVIDLLFDAFPGGSITGCPKRRSMEIIDALEPFSRGIYCGTIFRINDKSNIDSSICIRTGIYNKESGVFGFYAGSGIVYDSAPAAEHAETMSKAEKFREAFK